MDKFEIKDIWQTSKEKNLVKANKEELSKQIVSNLNSFNKSLKRSTYREITVAGLMIPFFIYTLFIVPGLLSQIGALIIISGLILIIYKMYSAHRSLVNSEIEILNTSEYLLKRKEELIKQMKQIDNVIIWYISPLAVGVIIFILGYNLSIQKLLISLGIVIIINAFVYLINKRAVKKGFLPLIKELEETINTLKSK